ncbi:hypothetical protein TNCT_87191 [Trichonephila clavata]|uniref:Uncharacterized protein n=1 Tax=Trichonephila clavata TaxID=2740835 RepID=A0A8X6KPM7_TRICU|nr:hypothetical protein TNCT_87191 [Trichonephila clavata]
MDINNKAMVINNRAMDINNRATVVNYGAALINKRATGINNRATVQFFYRKFSFRIFAACKQLRRVILLTENYQLITASKNGSNN